VNYHYGKQVVLDFYWGGGSLIFVFMYLLLYLRSLMLASYSILLIIFSFPVTQLIYSQIFEIKYFSTLHYMVAFIVIGVGVDDIFVIVDAWR